MKKYVKYTALIVLLAMLCFAVCSCNGTEVLDNNGQNKEYKYSVVRSEGMNKKVSDVFIDATELGIYTETENITLDDVDKTIVSPFTSQRLDYMHSESSRKTSKDDTIGTFYSVYDEYNCERENMLYLHGTDLLCMYYYREEFPLKTKMALSKAEAIELANDFLLSFLSKEQMDKFERPVVTDETAGTFMYYVTYTRKVAGYDTDEDIMVFISLSGKVTGYNGKNLDKYDSCADKINADDVKEAEKALEAKIRSLNLPGCSMRSPVIITNTSGELFLRIDTEYRNDEITERLDSFLINILSGETASW